MKGFFTKEETRSKSRPDGKTYSCASCGLYKGVQSPKMEPTGNFAKEILIIGQSPSAVDDERGAHWQGKTGRILKRTLEHLGIDLFEDCLSINAVNCAPSDNKEPSNYEIACCKNVIVDKVIRKYEPKLILLLGESAVKSFIGNRWRKELGKITKWRGWNIPDRDYNAWVCPTFHPSFIERSDLDAAENIWVDDLSQSLEFLNKSFPPYVEPTFYHISNLSPLWDIKKGNIAFDYETTGLKPQSKGHRIVCGSVAWDENNAYIFEMPKTKKERQPLIDLLENSDVGKIASNMKYEDQWTYQRLLGTEINNWYWDTMLAAHVFDNRPGITSIKFQTYIHLGIVDYASEIEPYLKSDGGSANSINKIFELVEKPGGMDKLLKYCGYDSIYEYRIAMHQISQLHDLPF